MSGQITKKLYMDKFIGYDKHTEKHVLRMVSDKRGGVKMTEKEMLKISVEEFSRVQDYLMAVEKGSDAWKLIRRRYIELKVILQASGINLTELDIIKE